LKAIGGVRVPWLRVNDECMSNTDEIRWAAVTGKDESANGQFVYSVASTGVYCRPSCPARMALRRNVQFYDSCADAERAGFRPCKRCRPNEASLAARHADLVRNACRTIEASEALPALQELAALAHLSRFHFLRIFRKVTGVTPGQYAAEHRAERVRSELRGGTSITNAIYDAGFNSSSRFYEKAPEWLGMTPGQFRRGGSGVAIRYATRQSSLGLVMIAATDRGICSVRFGENEAALVEELRRGFPAATISAAGAEFEASVNAVVEHIDNPRATFDLPLDIRGTAFQMRVWQALREIPVGQTATYSEVAARAGNPAAVRAVGSACGANPIAVLVPCHRAVRADGGAGGYRWGLERKRKLLDMEVGATRPAGAI
jgi:AraC family transcriptional regulator, regulatory protein of adaptative response / methylated-DNA-[protein]-cysteine methyltransferase